MSINFETDFQGYVLILLSVLLITIYCIMNIIKSKTKVAKFREHISPLPAFMAMVHAAGCEFNPKDEEAKVYVYHWQNSFNQLKHGKELRQTICDLNDETFKAYFREPDQIYGGARAKRKDLASNIGFAFVELTSGDNVTNHVKEELSAIAANSAYLNGKDGKRGPIEKPVNSIKTIKKPKYQGIKNFNACTENRILNHMEKKYGGNLQGNLKLFTERIPCNSCMGVIKDFRKDNQELDITITFIYGDEFYADITDEDYEKVKELVHMNISVNLVGKVSNVKPPMPERVEKQDS